MGAGLQLQGRTPPSMNLFVDTSVWSLSLRRDHEPDVPQVRVLAEALQNGGPVFVTGIVLQELLQGLTGAKARDRIVDRFAALPLLVPDRADHIGAADLKNACRRTGVQVGTIDALLAQLCLRYELTMLSTDGDFERMATVCPLVVWK